MFRKEDSRAPAGMRVGRSMGGQRRRSVRQLVQSHGAAGYTRAGPQPPHLGPAAPPHTAASPGARHGAASLARSRLSAVPASPLPLPARRGHRAWACPDGRAARSPRGPPLVVARALAPSASGVRGRQKEWWSGDRGGDGATRPGHPSWCTTLSPSGVNSLSLSLSLSLSVCLLRSFAVFSCCTSVDNTKVTIPPSHQAGINLSIYLSTLSRCISRQQLFDQCACRVCQGMVWQHLHHPVYYLKGVIPIPISAPISIDAYRSIYLSNRLSLGR